MIIEDDKYYVIHIYRDNVGKLRNAVIKKPFKYKYLAKRALLRVVSRRELVKFDILKGEIIKYYGLELTMNSWEKKILLHDYPAERLTKQERKSFRTKVRRWRRDYKIELEGIKDNTIVI